MSFELYYEEYYLDEKIILFYFLNKFHIKKHYELVVQCSPVSIEDLADILAMIRPNKINLKDKYIKNKNSVRELLYEKHDESDLRKSHAIAYAMNIVIQMNLIKLGAEF